MATKPHVADLPSGCASVSSWIVALDTRWREISLRIFMVIVLAHWAEHLAQAYQIYALSRPVPAARRGSVHAWQLRHPAAAAGGGMSPTRRRP